MITQNKKKKSASLKEEKNTGIQSEPDTKNMYE
jgi:hypothetical protein